MTRYVLHPGYVTSRTDGDRHYIGSSDLLRLYGVDPRAHTLTLADHIDHRCYRARDGDVHLHPRFDGNYTLPNEPLRPKLGHDDDGN